MIQLKRAELLEIYGGSINGTLINAFARAINSLLDLGRSLGNAIRRIASGNLC